MRTGGTAAATGIAVAVFAGAGVSVLTTAPATAPRVLSRHRAAATGRWRSQSLKPPTYSRTWPSPSNAMTLVATLSTNSRSWLTNNKVPLNSAIRSSSSSSVSTSRSLVGSSMTSKLAGCANNRASNRRFRSPPDNMETGEFKRSGGKRKSCSQPETWRRCPLMMTLSPPPVTFSMTVAAGSNCARCWSKYATSSFVPCRTLPDCGSNWPSSKRSSVVLPAPFGPSKARRSPRMTRKFNPRTNGTSP